MVVNESPVKQKSICNIVVQEYIVVQEIQITGKAVSNVVNESLTLCDLTVSHNVSL